LLLLTLPAVGQAQFTYTTNGGAITIARYTGSESVVIIPSSINGLPVTSIGDSAFKGYSFLTSVTVPDTITNIGNSAFLGCRSLTNVTIPEGISSIQDSAFASCSSLSSFIIPEGVTYIGWYAFSGTSLTQVIIPEGVTYIGGYAFAGTSLTHVTIPNSVTVVWFCAFLACANLTNVTISSSIAETHGGTFYDCTNLRSVTIPSNVHTILDTDFADCPNLLAMYFQGNAPALLPDPESGMYGMVFSNNPSLTVYYLPGTTGWGSTFGGRPAVLWNPLMQASGPNFGVLSNQFGFTISGTTNIPIVVEASVNLPRASWTPLQSCTITNGAIYFSDSAWTNYPARFYRIRSP
jgi:hypothetical protein